MIGEGQGWQAGVYVGWEGVDVDRLLDELQRRGVVLGVWQGFCVGPVLASRCVWWWWWWVGEGVERGGLRAGRAAAVSGGGWVGGRAVLLHGSCCGDERLQHNLAVF